MDLRYPVETKQFRADVRSWVTAELARHRASGDEFTVGWQQALYDSGWACPTWPTEFGGRGISVLQAAIAAEEFANAGAPLPRATGGELLVGPTILHWGTDEQRNTFLPAIAGGRMTWCQGFSEPQAGSDLAAVATRAVRDGDEWVFTGHKIWTSEAEDADYMFLLAVTEPDASPHHRLTYFLLPMHQSGIEIRPIAQLDGRAGFNEVVLDGARCAADSLIGETGKGWQVAMGTLGFERGISAFADHHRFSRELAGVIANAKRSGRISDPIIRDRLVRAWSDVQILRLSGMRLLTAAVHPGADPYIDRVAGVHKFFYTEFHQRLTDLGIDVLGPQGQILTGAMTDPPVPGVGMGHRTAVHDYPVSPEQSTFLFSKAGTIYGGTSQIQRNIVAERILGLPRGPR